MMVKRYEVEHASACSQERLDFGIRQTEAFATASCQSIRKACPACATLPVKRCLAVIINKRIWDDKRAWLKGLNRPAASLSRFVKGP